MPTPSSSRQRDLRSPPRGILSRFNNNNSNKIMTSKKMVFKREMRVNDQISEIERASVLSFASIESRVIGAAGVVARETPTRGRYEMVAAKQISKRAQPMQKH